MANKKYPFTRADRLLIAMLCLLGILFTVWIYRPHSSNSAYLEVRQNGVIQYTLPLDKNVKKTISDSNGNINHFQIQDGIVTMTNANCTDHTCVNTQGISEISQSIVCLPHRLSLTIVAKKENKNNLDAVVQ